MEAERSEKMEDLVVISNARTGMKREFAFAHKSRNEIVASLGPTRTRKAPVGAGQITPTQRLKKQVKRNDGGESKGEELYKEIDDKVCFEVLYDVGSTGDVITDFSTSDDGDDMSNKVVPEKVKDLLKTGLLEGLPSKPESGYIHGVARGVAHGVAHAISPNEFELDAGSKNKRHADNIFMEKGNSFCGLKASDVSTSYVAEFEDISKSVNEDEYEESIELASNKENLRRTTRKHCKRHKLVLENDNMLPEGTDLFYHSHGKILLSGYKQGTGIFCMCCQQKVSPSLFEAHAGFGRHKKPYHHIFTSEGTSLYMLAMSLSGEHEHDERVLHQERMHLQENPDDTRYNSVGNDVINVEESNFDDKERQFMHLAETEESVELDSSGCFLCGLHDFVKDGFGPRTILICDQCDREYHVGCLQKFRRQDLKELPQGKWYCSDGCDKIDSTLQQLIKEGGRAIPYSLLDIILSKNPTKDSNEAKLDVQWRLLSGKMSSLELDEKLLSYAVSIFHDQFSPIFLPGSTTDLIPLVVYGKNLEDKDFGGMYCAVLIVNSQVVSAGVFRIYGNEIAELPLIATDQNYEQLGYFQALYFCIENLLGEMEVKHLSLPATNKAKPIWTKKLGFSKFPKDELADVGRRYQLMPFGGTTMLRKVVPKISR